MLQREWGAESTYSSLVKLQPRFLSLQWKTCLWTELQPWCLSFAVKDLPLGRTLMMMKMIIINNNNIIIVYRCGGGGSMRACHAAGLGSILDRERFPR